MTGHIYFRHSAGKIPALFLWESYRVEAMANALRVAFWRFPALSQSPMA